ncbi:hypothetical protein CHUAL_010330 [Chamberlinius hualienensis]
MSGDAASHCDVHVDDKISLNNGKHVLSLTQVNELDISSETSIQYLNWYTCKLSKMASKPKLVVCSLGIFLCYFYYGIIQEKITRGKYGDKNEFFTQTVALVFCQCIINAIFAKLVLSTVMPQGRDTTKSIYYAASSFTYLAAMVTSNMALLHVSYPTQVVGKSCKPIPVMILGVLIGHKKYTLRKYLFVLMIVIGVALFIYKDDVKKSGGSSSVNSFFGTGELLLLISLAMDGFTGAVQDRMRAEHQSKSGHMMLSMNLWSVLFSGIVLLVTGEGMEFIYFLNKYPSLISQILTFSVASALGQFFIFLTVSEFGPLVCSIITTTRKLFTVLTSVLFFGNVLSTRQIAGTTMVFTGLTLDSYYGKSSK